MTITDIIALTFLAVITTHGFYQGLLRSLAEPVILLFTIALSSFIYFTTKNLLLSILICFPARFLFAWLIKIGIKKLFPPLDDSQLALPTRMGGLAVNLLWGSAVVLFTTAVLAILPLKTLELENVQKDIKQSKALAVIKPVLIKYGLLANQMLHSSCIGDLCNMDEQEAQSLLADGGVQEIMNDPRIQKLMQDKDAMAAIEKRDLAALFKNPVITELTADPAFLMKAMQAASKIQQMVETPDTAGK